MVEQDKTLLFQRSGIKPNYVLIPLIALAVSSLGNYFTSLGKVWYETLALPAITPPGALIGAVWTALFILAALAALIIWNTAPRGKRFRLIIAVFAANAVLNALWSALFFTLHFIGAALIDALALETSALLLIVLSWKRSRLAALLLVPYAAWVAFAIYLNYLIWTLN